MSGSADLSSPAGGGCPAGGGVGCGGWGGLGGVTTQALMSINIAVVSTAHPRRVRVDANVAGS